MKFVRSTVAQYYRSRGNSFGHRGFSSSGSKYNAFGDAMNTGESVKESIFGHLFGLFLGIGLARLIMGTNDVAAIELQVDLDKQQRELDEIQAKFKELQKTYGAGD